EPDLAGAKSGDGRLGRGRPRRGLIQTTRHGDHADADRKGRPRPRRHPGRLLPERPNRVCRPASSRGEPGLIVAILGPTASGKTRTAIEVALAIGAEIVSVDSMQVYRGWTSAPPSRLQRSARAWSTT